MAKKTKSKAKPKATRAKKPVARAKAKTAAPSSAKRSATKGAVPQSSLASVPGQDASTGKFLADLAKVAVRAAAASPLAKQVADAALARATEAAQGLAAGMIDTVAGKVRSAAQPRKKGQQNGNVLPEP